MAIPEPTPRAGFNTLLVATDLSARSQTALWCAAAMAHKSGAKIVVAHVITPGRWHLVPPQEMHPALCHDRRSTEKKMACLLKSDRLRGVRTDAVIKEGDFRRVLCNIVHEQHVDLLIASTHGRKGFSKLLFGSKVEEVCNKAPCPVLLVGPKVRQQQYEEYRKVLFTTDLTPLSLGALPPVLAFAAQHGSQLRIARVLPEDENKTPAEGKEFAVAQLRAEILPALTARAGLACEPDFVVRYGSPKETILGLAEEWGADVIGMGGHRPGTLAVYLPGDLAYEVATDARCPVLTIID